MSLNECLCEAAQIVNMKIQTDALDDRSNQTRDSMPEFLMDRYISKFNMKTAATKSLHVIYNLHIILNRHYQLVLKHMQIIKDYFGLVQLLDLYL